MAAQRRSPYFRNLRLRFHGYGSRCCLEPTARRGIFETSGITREVKKRGVGEAFLWRWRSHNVSDLQAWRCCRYTEVSQTSVRDGFAHVVKIQEFFLAASSPLSLPSYIALMATYITPCLKFSHNSSCQYQTKANMVANGADATSAHPRDAPCSVPHLALAGHCLPPAVFRRSSASYSSNKLFAPSQLAAIITWQCATTLPCRRPDGHAINLSPRLARFPSSSLFETKPFLPHLLGSC